MEKLALNGNGDEESERKIELKRGWRMRKEVENGVAGMAVSQANGMEEQLSWIGEDSFGYIMLMGLPSCNLRWAPNCLLHCSNTVLYIDILTTSPVMDTNLSI